MSELQKNITLRILTLVLIIAVVILFASLNRQEKKIQSRSLKRYLGGKFKVVKTYHDKSVFLLDQDNIRHHIPDWATFIALGYDVNDIVTVTDAEMAGYTIGNPLNPIVEEQVHNPFERCPCYRISQYMESLKVDDKKRVTHTICFIDSKSSREVIDKYELEKIGINYSIVPENYTYSNYHEHLQPSPFLTNCSILLEISPQDIPIKYECPEKCVPVPYSMLSLSWFTNFEKHLSEIPDVPITCSMTWRQLFEYANKYHDHHLTHHFNHIDNNPAKIPTRNRYLQSQPVVPPITPAEAGEGVGAAVGAVGAVEVDSKSLESHINVGIFLKAILRRRLEECQEEEYWPASNPSSNHIDAIIPRRKVLGLIIWIGSRTRYDLLEDQIFILKNQSFSLHSNDVIVGWMASEDQYSCRLGSSLCDNSLIHGTNYYHAGMPTTRMNVAASGWSCAQRRPLRAISHTLLLYDPTFLLLVDDDSYVSIDLILSSKFQEFVRKDLIKSHIVLGQLTQGRKITRHGFYYGGAGYLFGKTVIDELHGKVLRGPNDGANSFIDGNQMRELSLLYETAPASQQFCTGCIQVHSDFKIGDLHVQVNTSSRIIDLCVNIMSQEHTCYHSDHAMTRCLLHGVYAAPLDVGCGGSMVGSSRVVIGMCMGTSFCNPDVQLTCHRWKPSRENVRIAVNLLAPSSSDSPSNATTTVEE
jgi:hypothetical protein